MRLVLFATINGKETALKNSTFTSTGNITFGTHQFQETHVLYWRTLGLGHETNAPHSNEILASTVWEVTGGKGVFFDAYGVIVTTCRILFTSVEDLTCFSTAQLWVHT